MYMCYNTYVIKFKLIYGVTIMNIYKNSSETQKIPCVIALGDFDGVHTGHSLLIDAVKKLSNEYQCKSGIYTFSINTKRVLNYNSISLLTTEPEKNRLLVEHGMDFVFYEDFLNVKNLTPQEFCDYLYNSFELKGVVCGENFTFGKNAVASSHDLFVLMKNKGVDCKIIPSFSIKSEQVSSTAIRGLIDNGLIEKANEMLGYQYFIEAPIVHGRHLGRILGFPTINQEHYGFKAIPSYGVYCCKCTIDGIKYIGVTNVGVKPTIKSSEIVNFETHIIDYDGDLYGKTIRLEFYKKLRNEIKFPNLDELKKCVLRNIDETKEYFKKDGHLQ